MKNLLFLINIIFAQICFGQNDSLKEPLIDQVFLLNDNYTQIPFSDSQSTTSRCETEGTRKESLGAAAAYATAGIIAKIKTSGNPPILNAADFYRGKPLPTLLFSGYSREIDSSMQDSLNIIYNMMSENSSMIVQVVGLFQHEKNFSPFQKRAIAVKDRLVEMGIVEDRLKTMVKQYTELKDPTVTRDKANVIFEIISFDYLPPLTPP